MLSLLGFDFFPVYRGKIGEIIRYSMGAAPAWMFLVEMYKHKRWWMITFIAFRVALSFYFLFQRIGRELAG